MKYLKYIVIKFYHGDEARRVQDWTDLETGPKGTGRHGGTLHAESDLYSLACRDQDSLVC